MNVASAGEAPADVPVEQHGRRWRMDERQFALLGLSLLLGYLGFAGCHSLYADPASVRSRVEAALPEGASIVSVREDDCGLAPHGCTVTYWLEADGALFEEHARAMRQALRRAGWEELRFGVTHEVAGGAYKRDGARLSFSFISTAPDSLCSSGEQRPYGGACTPNMSLSVPGRGIRMFGIKLW
jgi:hypothetical protein